MSRLATDPSVCRFRTDASQSVVHDLRFLNVVPKEEVV